MLNKAFWGERREEFFRALIALTESGKISWQRSDDNSSLSEERDDALFRATYEEGKFSVASNERGSKLSIKFCDGMSVEIGNEDDPLVQQLYDVVYNSQFPDVKKIMDDVIKAAKFL